MLLLDMAYRLLREFRQAFTRLDTPPFSNRRHPGSDIAPARHRPGHTLLRLSTFLPGPVVFTHVPQTRRCRESDVPLRLGFSDAEQGRGRKISDPCRAGVSPRPDDARGKSSWYGFA